MKTRGRKMQNVRQTLYNEPGRGFTYIEVIIAIAIFFLIAAAGFQSFSLFKKNADIDAAADAAVSMLSRARTRTVAAEGGAQYGVHFESATLTLFAGSAYVSGAAGNEPFVIPTTVEMSAVSVSGGGDDVVFMKLTGETAHDGTVTFRLASDTSRTRTVRILSTGLASMEE